MKALVLVGKERVEMQEMAAPTARDGEVLLRVRAAGICGSDIHGFLGHSPRRQPGLVLGHEAVGVVEQTGAGVSSVQVGQRVYINPLISCGACDACRKGRENNCANWRLIGMDRVHGAYAEYVAVPANQVRAIPDRVSDDRAVWAEPLANLVHCFRISMNEVPQSMAVLGAGTIGALGIMLGKMRGIRRIVAVDKNEARLNAAREIGADEVVSADDPVAAEKVGMADYVLEAVGVSAMRRLALGVCRRGGRMGFLGLAENETSLPFNEMIRNEQALFTSFAYTPKDFAESVRVIESGQKMLEKWMETRPLAEGQEAFMKMTHDPGATLKLVLQVGEMK